MQAEPKIIEKVLGLLREWGWEAGLEKLEAEIGWRPTLSLHEILEDVLAEEREAVVV